MDLAELARAQGACGLGPVRTLDQLASALERGVVEVQSGALCVIDVRVAPEYSRAVSSSLLRNIGKGLSR